MIVVVGVSHKTAPIELRERLALSEETAGELCTALTSLPEVAEAFVVSTCNRVEIVAVPSEVKQTAHCAQSCVTLLCQNSPELQPFAYVRQGVEAMRHLVRVASSLDSLVVGEPQILGQLKAGFLLAQQRGTIGATLHRAFSAAVRGAKRIRSETSIGAGQVSVPSIAVQLAGQIFGDLRDHRVALVGSGDMGKSVASLFADQGAKLTVLGRSLERVRLVTEELGGQALLMEELGRVLSEADVVVSSTSAQGTIVSQSELKKSWKARRGRNLFLIDLAVPRDIEPAAGELDGVFLYNIDDLSQVANESAEARRKEADRAAVLVDGVVRRWEQSWHAEQATPVLTALRTRMRAALALEMQRSLRGRLRDLDEEQRAALQKMLESGVNRILHAPTTRIRQEAGREGVESVDDVLSLLSDLFELGEQEESSALDSILPDASETARVSRSAAPVDNERESGATSAPRTPAGGDEPEAGSAEGASAACAPARFSGA
jgi:glutamyl-tRNA reductase